MRRCRFRMLGALFALVAAQLLYAQDQPKVAPIPDELRQSLKLDPFYQKHTDYKGYLILSSAKVSDAALLEARYLISRMLADRDDIVKALVAARARFTVMAPTEMTTDVPEQKHLKNDPKTDWDKRARGLGGKLTSCGEENLLNLRGDRYRNENILIHEFAHCIHNIGLRAVDRTFNDRLRKAYARAMEAGLWGKTYAATNAGEYWAEGVQSYFDCNAPRGGVHNDINTREKLEKYDPELFKLIDEVFKQSKFRYARYDRRAQAVEPITYTVRFPAPDKHLAEVEAIYPTDGRASIELMMPVWTPGFYRVENYAGKVQDLSARTPDGQALGVEQPRKNRWTVQTGGARRVVVSYKLRCESRSVTTNWVDKDLAVLNGAATFLTLVETGKRPHNIRLELAAQWKQSMTGLDAAPDGQANHYRAADFDAVVDSPIVAGNLEVRDFDVDGSRHFVVHAGDFTGWDGKRAAADLETLVKEHRRMWGALPFQRYVFLCVFRRGGGGLEHRNSTLLTCSATAMRTPAAYLSWLNFVSHEYFHAFNVKRLRPVELGPFDYENAPRTTGLWVAEGVTSYYDGLLTTRAGLGAPKDFLARLSGHIDRLQKSPGRLVQTLEQSSYDVWTSGFSGLGGGSKTVSYYVKGPVVAFLLDAKVRRETQGAKTLDDVMKLAYQRYSGEKGFTAEQFRKATEEVAGVDLQAWFTKAIGSTEELNYAEALDWFGLRFAPGDAATKTWRLEVRDDATAAQRDRLKAWLEPAGG